MRKVLSPILVAALTIGSLGVLANLAGLRDGSSIALGSPSAVSTVRAYYAAVNHYITTGEIESVYEIAGPAIPGVNNRTSPGCEVVSLLPALRRTYPHMHITIDDLLRDGSTVVAQVSVDAGLAMSFDSVGLLPLEHRWMTEIFTVEDGRIVKCASFGPGQALVATMHRIPRATAPPGTLVIARISFARDAPDYLSIPAPAIVSVEHGSIETPGNGVSVLFRGHGLQAETTEAGRKYVLVPGDELAISAGNIVLHNPEANPASVLATTVLPHISDVGEAEASSPVRRLFERLAAPGSGQVGAGTWARTLVRAVELISTSPGELTGGTIIVTPGGSAMIESAGMDMVFVPMTGSPDIERSGAEVKIRNPGDDQVLVRIAWLESSAPP